MKPPQFEFHTDAVPLSPLSEEAKSGRILDPVFVGLPCLPCMWGELQGGSHVLMPVLCLPAKAQDVSGLLLLKCPKYP